MNLSRGDVVTVVFPFASGTGAKLRPALVVQNNTNNRRLTNVIVAAITTTTHRSGQPTQLLVDIRTAVGKSSGLLHDSVITCENLATIEQQRVRHRIGSLPVDTMQQVDKCLQASLGIS